jgi:hypothetical protein
MVFDLSSTPYFLRKEYIYFTHAMILLLIARFYPALALLFCGCNFQYFLQKIYIFFKFILYVPAIMMAIIKNN